jgi:hypothetical protein
VSAPELDALAADAVAGEIARASRHALPLGAPCPNCGTPLAGPWCHECGQKGEEYHRNIWHLFAEAFEGLTHFDSRIWNTLPKLVLRPGKLTHEYLEGHRAAQIPPFRLFLIVLLLVFFAGGLAVDQNRVNFKVAPPDAAVVTKDMTPKEKADYEQAMAQVKSQLAADAPAAANPPSVTVEASDLKLDLGRKNRRGAWAKSQIKKAVANPEAFFFAVESWGHRFAILMLPVAALMLTGLFAFRRGVYVFDHVIFSMHSLSFVGLLLTAIFLLSMASPLAWWLLLAAPAHLFVHMRGTYRTGVFGTLVRMWLLFVGTVVTVGLMIVGLVFAGLSAV